MAQLDETERLGDYGGVLAQDDEPSPRDWNIAALLNPRYLSESMDRVEGLRRLGVAFGALLIIALIFVCFQFAFRTAERVADSRGLARRGEQYMNEDDGGRRGFPGAPGGAHAGAPFVGGSRVGGFLPPAAAMPPANMPPPVQFTISNTDSISVFDSPESQGQAAALLQESRDAYDLTKKLDGGAFWQRPTRSTQPGTNSFVSGGTGGAGVAAAPPAATGPAAVAPLPSGADISQETVDPNDPYVLETRTQLQSVASVVGLTMHPDYYPPHLRNQARAYAQEMRVYLSTVDHGLLNPRDQSNLRSTAAPHLERAGEILGELEKAAKTGVLPRNQADMWGLPDPNE